MKSIDLKNHFEFAARRIYWIIIPFLAVLLGGLYFVSNAPRVYESETLILIQSLEDPEDNGSALVSSDINGRLNNITRQIKNRKNLEEIVEEYRLYGSTVAKNIPLEEKVRTMGESIFVEPGNNSRERGALNNTFTLKFQYHDPEQVMKATNKLASKLIKEGILLTETQKPGTAPLLDDELENKKRQLTEIEENIKEYQSKYMGQLPDQLNSNLAVLNNLQVQLERYNINLNSLEDRKLLMQQQTSTLREPPPKTDIRGLSDNSDNDELSILRSRLEGLEGKYTPNHPDVRRLKDQIAKIEQSKTNAESKKPVQQVDNLAESSASADNTKDGIAAQLAKIESDIKSLKREKRQLEKKIETYEQIIEEAPKREQELISLKRKYSSIKESYDKLLSSKLETNIAANLEKQQKKLQLTIIEPAEIPLWPVKPDFKKIMGLVFIIASCLGFGLAFLVECSENSFKNPEQLEVETGIPVLSSIGIIYSKIEIQKRKIKSIFEATATVLVFIISAFTILYFAKVSNSLNAFVEKIIGIYSKLI